MTPKEKAKELIEKYIEIMPCLVNQTGNKIIQHAKKCSLIAVDEYIKTNWYNPSVREFYEKVKLEILK